MKKSFTYLFLFLPIIVYCQCSYEESVPFELYRGRYKPASMNYGNPYTMFNKRTPNWNLNNDLVNVIKNIVSSPYDRIKTKEITSYGALYKGIYNAAVSTDPGKCSWDAECSHSEWVKQNAIVYLIGLVYTTDSSGRDKFIYLEPNNPTRVAFALRAADGLSNLNPKIEPCNFGCNTITFKALNLILYLQAYDALKAAGYYRFGDGDRNGGDCSARNKLREYTRNLYIEADEIINNTAGWKKNHGLISAGVLGLAAIVLNDAGVTRSYWDIPSNFFDYLTLDFTTWPRPNYSPLNWIDRSLGTGGGILGEGGIEDNMFKGIHYWGTHDVPQTNSDGTAGYAEGPGYYEYALNSLLPFMRAQANFIDKWQRPLLHDERHRNILRWFQSIARADNTLPTYDNSKIGVSNLLGILGDSEFYTSSSGIAAKFYADYLLANASNSTEPSIKDKGNYINHTSGNAVLKMENNGSNHYFHFLYETGHAIDKSAHNGISIPMPIVGTISIDADGTHDDSEMGSFMISVDKDWLAIDPPYLGYKHVEETPYFDMHNTITVPGNPDEPELIIFPQSHKVELKLTKTGSSNFIKRELSTYITNGTLYYILNDRINSTNGFVFRFNGNGSINDTGTGAFAIKKTFIRTNQSMDDTTSLTGRIFKWMHPCYNSIGSWNILLHTSFKNGAFAQPSFTLNTSNKHGSGVGQITNHLGNLDGMSYGIHTQLKAEQLNNSGTLQSFILPYKCAQLLPSITKDESSSDFVTTTIRFIEPRDTSLTYYGKNQQPPSSAFINDTTFDLHIARQENGVSTIINPFQRSNDSDTLVCEARSAYASYSTYSKNLSGFCSPSIISLKKVSLTNGSSLKYKDTFYIYSTATFDAIEYKYKKKFHYEGYAKGIGVVKFYLPDLELGYDMIAAGEVVSSSTHDANDSLEHKFINITFSGEGRFTIELSNPCLLSCFFPPTITNIDSVFNFHTNTRESLGHDLDILAGDGLLSIRGGSQVDICPQFVLVNKDSIVMKDGCSPMRMTKYVYTETDTTKITLPPDTMPYICDRNALLEDRNNNRERNMIIINDKAALVLDSGSTTHIGNNSTIIVKQGGTLLIKSGAKVIVGDSGCVQNRGELLADRGAYVCIEDGSELIFYNDISLDSIQPNIDTVDRHIVFIHMGDDINNQGANLGVNESGGRGKFVVSDTSIGIWSSNSCVEFCSWKGNGIGVLNPDFGWSNLNFPHAYYESLDTICLNKSFYIDAKRSLNEVTYKIIVCSYDTSSNTCISNIKTINGNIKDKCLGEEYVFTPTQTGYFKISLIVKNDCAETDTFEKIIYVPNTPIAVLSIPNSICPGIGVLYANGLGSSSYLSKTKHRWSVEPIALDSIEAKYLIEKGETIFDWDIDSTGVSDSFNFPGYKFEGGLSYIITLRVNGYCVDTLIQDTVSVPLSAKINASLVSNYQNPVGPSAFELVGEATGATSFSWSPTTELDEPDSLITIARPSEPRSYVLSVTDGTCSDYDTIQVFYNSFAYAGADKSLCHSDDVILGTDFNALSFLSLIYYLEAGQLEYNFDLYCTSHDIEKYFTHFMVRDFNAHSDAFINQFKDDTLLRRYLMQMPNYATRFTAFKNAPNSTDAIISLADDISNDSYLTNYLSTNSYGITPTEVDEIFNKYVEWYDLDQAYEIQWESKLIDDTLWSTDSLWLNYFNRKSSLNKSHEFRITVNDQLNSIIEYDNVTILRDTTILVGFYPEELTDSTVWFTNVSTPTTSQTAYLWNFGDGGTSSLKHPTHTFPSSDSTYIICLTAVNECDSFTFCDTLTLDSNGMYFTYGKKGNDPIISQEKSIDYKSQINNLRAANKLFVNQPNPFSEKTSIEYQLKDGYSEAELRISNTLGQSVKTIKLKGNRGFTTIDGSQWKTGLYHYSLVVDGTVIDSKAMVVER